MLRITLDEDFGTPVILRLGSEVVVPMSFGGPTPEVMTDFRGERTALPAKPRIWTLSWETPDDRSCLVPNEVAVHWFGDWRAGSDAEAVRNKQIPGFNEERERVAMMWGDYKYTPLRGHYSTIKIAVPKMPRVTIHAVNANGSTVGDWVYKPWDFFKFESQIDQDAKAEYEAAVKARDVQLGRGTTGLTGLSEDDLDHLETLLQKRRESRKAVKA